MKEVAPIPCLLLFSVFAGCTAAEPPDTAYLAKLPKGNSDPVIAGLRRSEYAWPSHLPPPRIQSFEPGNTARAMPDAASADYPTAEWFPGRPGIVKSPFTGHPVDMAELPPGAEVRDPETKQIFILPAKQP